MVINPIIVSLTALSVRSSSLLLVNLLKYKQERKREAAAKQLEKIRQAQAERDNLLYYKRLEAAAKQEKERQKQAERDNCKDAEEKQERQARQEREREAAAKQEKERQAQAQAERDNIKDAKEKQEREARQEREREAAAKQEKERQAQAQAERDNIKDAKEKQERQARQEREREAAAKQEKERQAQVQAERDNIKDAKEKQERQARQEREREAEKDQKSKAYLEVEEMMAEKFKHYLEEKAEAEQQAREEIFEKLKHLEEKVEAEKRDRIEGERKMASLIQTMERRNGLLKYMIMQRDHHSRYNYQTLEYEEHVKSLAYFDLPEDNNKDLENIFNASFIDNPYNPLDATESSEHLNCERDIEYEDIHRLAMTKVNDMLGHENSQDITVLELNYQLFGDLEDDMVSSAIIPVSNVEGTRAKEEGNTYFKEQKFEEAIKCYSKSIDELPTVEAYSNRAMAYIKLNKFIEAEQDCTDALNIDDRYFKAYARRAIARTKLGCNLEGALEDVKVALKLESNNQEMNELLMSLKAARKAKDEGNDLYKHQKFEEAIKCYSVSINESPTAVAYCNRAMAYSKLDKLMEVENDCTNALKFDNQYFKAYARRAIAREKLGDNIKGALSDVEAALKLEPNSQEMKELHAKLIQTLG